MRRAVREEFSDVHVFGCHFHYAQSLVKRAKSCGLREGISKPGAILSNFLAFKALPLLPPNLILPTFEALAARAKKLHVGFLPFLEYMTSHWLHTIGPGDLSVFGLQQRTNNDVEANNGKLLRKTGHRRPVWSLLATITDLAQDVALDRMIHDRGVENINSRPSKPTRLNKLRVNMSWDLLTRGDITAMEFINRVKFKVGKRNHLLTLRKEGHTGDPILKAWLEEQSGNFPDEDSGPSGNKHGDDSSDVDDADVTSSGDSSCDRSEEDSVSVPHGIPCQNIPKRDDFHLFWDHTYARNPNSLAPRYEQPHDRFPPITLDMKKTIKDALEERSDVIGDVSVSKLAVSSEDLRTLIGLSWLNDVIINVYLNLIVNRSRDNPRLPKVYTFNTFFLECYRKHGYADVSRWTRRDDIFAHDIVLVPVHSANHWSMAIVDFRRKLIRYMDSLGHRNDEFLIMLRDYLANEMLYKKKSILNSDEWHLKNEEDIPLQENGSDCGVFALKYADYAARDTKIDFSQKDMSHYREMIMYEILQSSMMPITYVTE
ncbi:ubiquitin-like-specific protease 1D [Galendromus occidentalis]|uniref:Ubiquitin-like-specific protease 1D n=1 Tax=Galendromus occidentalis TaxID=34638 RepID=A0AAJ6QNA4_9ACAR|nr:ubiquitin-like-specific protease 1D [Galendromus occidentalis]